MVFVDYLKLIRINQWYKNSVIFLAIFFVGEIFKTNILWTTILGFLALCLISSTNYIINDLIDIKKDRIHPEKKYRPLASEKINKTTAIILAFILSISSIIISIIINIKFLVIIASLFFLTLGYTFFLKKIVIADIITISTLFAIRSISGAYLINISISPWLILCPFFLSIFLAVGKRHSDLLFLKETAVQTREVLKNYDLNLTNSLMLISTTLLIISYALYSFLSIHQNLIYTIPLALFVILYYYQLTIKGSAIARNPEKIINDKTMIIGIISWSISTFLIIYI